MFKISTGLQEVLLQAIAAEFNGNMLMHIYGGAVPATAQDSIGSAIPLRVVSVNGTGAGMSFEAATSNGMLVKSASEVWEGENIATGTATFYRIQTSADTGVASTTLPRLQGSVDLLYGDLVLGSTALVAGVTDPPIGIFIVGMPLEPAQ